MSNPSQNPVSTDPKPSQLFKDYSLLNPSIQKALDSLGLVTPTKIQEKAFSVLLSTPKVDFHGQAQTGTGKTLAFGIPLIQSLDVSNRTPQALVVAPTRELVMQICESLQAVAKFMPITIEPIYGGVSIEHQMHVLRRGVHIVVGTPGRLNDHLRRKTLSLKGLRTLVLDEADIMLDMGFKEEIDEILKFSPEDRQIWLFSATVKPGIAEIKQRHMKDPVIVSVTPSQMTTSTTKQYYCIVGGRYRVQAVTRFIDEAQNFYGMIFCRTKLLADEVCQELSKKGYAVNALHGDMSQAIRNKVIKGFKDKAFTILVATDVAARGIDVSGLTHVINYSLPEDQESYVHRIGRTGRAGQEGIAITLVNRSETRRLEQLGRRFQASIQPLEIPSADSVFKTRLAQVTSAIDALCAKDMGRNAPEHAVYQLLKDRTPEALINGMGNLLFQSLLKGYNTVEEIPQESSGYGERREYSDRGGRSSDRGDRGDYRSGRGDRGSRGGERNFSDRGGSSRGGYSERERGSRIGSDEYKEIMIDRGMEHGVNKRDILSYCLQTQAVKEQDVYKIHIIRKRSYITLPTALALPFFKATRGQSLCGQQVRVQIVTPE